MTYTATATLTSLCAALLIALPAGVASAQTPAAAATQPPATVSARFDFAYVRSGAADLLPAAIFDNGRDTYLQWRPTASVIPSVFAVSDSGEERLLQPFPDGAYQRIRGVHGRLMLVAPGSKRAMLVHARASRDGAAGLQVVTNGVATPFVGQHIEPGSALQASEQRLDRSVHDDAAQRNSYATPARGDRIRWAVTDWAPSEVAPVVHKIAFPSGKPALSKDAARSLRNIASTVEEDDSVVIVGHDDSTHKEGLEMARATAMRQALVAAGVRAEAIRIRTDGRSLQSAAGWDSIIEVHPSPAPRRRAAAIGIQQEPVRANVQGLLSAGVLTYEQAQAILRRQGAQLTTPAVAQSRPVEAGADTTARYTLTPQDKTMSGAILRWAKSAGQSVLWQAPADLDAPITGTGEIQAPSLKAALDQVAQGMAAKGYPLSIQSGADGTIRVSSAGAAPLK